MSKSLFAAFSIAAAILLSSTVASAQQESHVFRYTNYAGTNYYARSNAYSPAPGFTLANTKPAFNVFVSPGDGLTLLYRCHQGTWLFLSVDANCEGSHRSWPQPLGYIYANPTPGMIPLYRDRNADWSKSVVTVQPYTTYSYSDILGYVPAQ